MTQQPDVDPVPAVQWGAPPQAKADIQIVGNDAVQMLDDLVQSLANVTDQKGAILRMIGIFHAAIGEEVLVQELGGEPRAVQGLWR